VSSSASLDDRGLIVTLDANAMVWGSHFARQLRVPAERIVRSYSTDALTVGRMLRWKIAGTGLSRQRAMGWFSRPGHRCSWACVWLTPGRAVRVIETTGTKPGLIAVPEDWFTVAD